MARRNSSRKADRRAAQRRAARQHTRARNANSSAGSALYRRPLRLESLEDRRLLAVVTVTTVADTINFNDGVTSLREAIFATNTVPGADTIEFAPALTAGGPAKILLTQGELAITDSLTIGGPGANLLTIDARGNDTTPDVKDGLGSRIFNTTGQVDGPRPVDLISGLTLTGGDAGPSGGAILNQHNLTLRGVSITGNSSREGGGGISSNTSTLTILDSAIENNLARSSGGIFVSGNLVVDRSSISHNVADSHGGGIFATNGNLTIVDSSISGNTLTGPNGFGGGVYFLDSNSVLANKLDIERSTISGNMALASGRGICVFMNNGVLTLADNTIAENGQVPGNGEGGGGLYANLTNVAATIVDNSILKNSARSGGGVFARVVGGSIVVDGNTISKNFATAQIGAGGGQYAMLRNTTATISHNTFSDNSAASGGGLSLTQFGVPTVLSDNTFTGNMANAANGRGGGILLGGDGGTTTIRNSQIANNQASGASGRGGGIFADGDRVTIETSTISGNSAGSFGGGIYNSTGLKIVDSTISGNTAKRGGGIDTDRSFYLQITRSTISGNRATAGGGGGVNLQYGMFSLFDSTISNNSAAGPGGGIAGPSFKGYNSPPPAIISHSIICQNTSDSDGGGIAFPSLQITDSQIVGNVATGNGGGIFAALPVSIRGSQIDGNSASQDGGGICLRSGNLTLQNSSLKSNSAGRDGGGLFESLLASQAIFPTDISNVTFSNNTAGRDGGGIASFLPLTLANSTVSGNSAMALGGGIWCASAASITHSTIVNNHADAAGGGAFIYSGALTVSQAIVAGNVAPFGRDLTGLIGTTITASYSLIGSNAGSGLPAGPIPVSTPDTNGNFIGGTAAFSLVDPHLGPLADNSGFVLPDGNHIRTHALLPDSPAIDAGDPSAQAGVGGVPVFDERGAPFIRVFGGRIDIGAFERLPEGFLPGDYNRDGMVDTADFSVWQDSMGMAVTPGTGDSADGNGDGVIEERDRVIVMDNLNKTMADLVPLITVAAPPAPLFETIGAVAPKASSSTAAVRTPPASPMLRTTFASPTPVRRVTSATNQAQRDDALLAWLESRVASRGVASSPPITRAGCGKGAADSVAELAATFDRALDQLGRGIQ